MKSSACEVAASLHVLLVTCYLPDIPRNYISVYIIEYTPKFVSSQICNFTDLKITLLINRCKSASAYSNIDCLWWEHNQARSQDHRVGEAPEI